MPRPVVELICVTRSGVSLAVGLSLARTIRDVVVHGYSPILVRLRGESDPVRLFASVPGIGPLLAARLHDELGLDSLQQLEAAAYDGRLDQIAGFGPKRLGGIRDTLARRLGHLLAEKRRRRWRARGAGRRGAIGC